MVEIIAEKEKNTIKISYIYEGKIVTRDKHKVELRETKLNKRINC